MYKWTSTNYTFYWHHSSIYLSHTQQNKLLFINTRMLLQVLTEPSAIVWVSWWSGTWWTCVVFLTFSHLISSTEQLPSSMRETILAPPCGFRGHNRSCCLFFFFFIQDADMQFKPGQLNLLFWELSDSKDKKVLNGTHSSGSTQMTKNQHCPWSRQISSHSGSYSINKLFFVLQLAFKIL